MLGRGTVFRFVGGFFLSMDVGAVLKHGFKQVTGCRVDGFWVLGVDYGMDNWLGDFVD